MHSVIVHKNYRPVFYSVDNPHRYVGRAYYDDDKLVLVLNYTGERCKVTLDLVESAVEGDGLGGSCFAPSSALNDNPGAFEEEGLRGFSLP